MLRLAMELAEEPLRATDPTAAADAFRSRVQRLGVSYVQVRRYTRPRGALTNARHWAAGGVLVRTAREGWVNSSGFNYICFDCNPLLGAIQHHRTRFRFSDFAPHGDRRFARYWEAMNSAGMADGWCANAYGSNGTIASIHLGVDEPAIDSAVGQALQIAGGMVAEHLLSLDTPYPSASSKPLLTRRERDVMRFVAQGKTDWEIGVILSVAETTARFHVDNARRKLGAVNRVHAVTRFIAEEGVD